MTLHQPRRMPRLLGALACWLLGQHRHAYNAERTWRVCYRCRCEERRLPSKGWPA